MALLKPGFEAIAPWLLPRARLLGESHAVAGKHMASGSGGGIPDYLWIGVFIALPGHEPSK